MGPRSWLSISIRPKYRVSMLRKFFTYFRVAKYQAAYAQNQLKDEVQRYAVELASKLANRF